MPDPTTRNEGHAPKFEQILLERGYISTEKINSKVTANSSSLVDQLPHNSPIRRDLIKQLSLGLSKKEVLETFNISERTYYRIQEDGKEFCINLKYAPGIKRTRISEDQTTVAEQFLDENFPVTSGRDYRVIRLTNDNLYGIYYYYCLERFMQPLGKTYFFTTFLKKQRIHYSKDESVCKYCSEYKNLEQKSHLNESEKNQLKKLEAHQKRWHEQSSHYLEEKNRIVNEKDTQTALIIHDFTQIKVQGTFFQDMIVCFYFYNEEKPDKLERLFHHFIAPKSNTANDSHFVFGVWREIVKKGLLQGFNKIQIYSDGGPKHYKTTSTMQFFGFLKNTLNVDLRYNFFESNHGHSICDGVAYHAKRAINIEQRNTGTAICTPDEICVIINKIKNHEGEIAKISNENKNFPTFEGIRKAMKFTFSNTHAFGHKLSKSSQFFQSWGLISRTFHPFFQDSQFS